jgi:hypothetical protein
MGGYIFPYSSFLNRLISYRHGSSVEDGRGGNEIRYGKYRLWEQLPHPKAFMGLGKDGEVKFREHGNIRDNGSYSRMGEKISR